MFNFDGPKGVPPLSEEQKIEITRSHAQEIEQGYEIAYNSSPTFTSPDDYIRLAHICTFCSSDA